MGEGGGASWSEINFYEDIDSSVVHGDISIQDAVGIIEGIPLIGEEFMEVRMSTAGATPTPISSPNNNTPPVVKSCLNHIDILTIFPLLFL